MDTSAPRLVLDLGILQADKDGLCRAASATLAHFLGASPAALVGEFIFALLPESERKDAIAAWESVTASNEPGSISARLLRTDGTTAAAVLSATPARGISALTDHWIISVSLLAPPTDDSELKLLRAELSDVRRRAEEQLKALRDEVGEVNRAKEVLLSSVEGSSNERIASLERDLTAQRAREDGLVNERNATVSELTLRLELVQKELAVLKAAPLAPSAPHDNADAALAALRAENITLTARAASAAEEIAALRRQIAAPPPPAITESSEEKAELERLVKELAEMKAARDALLTAAEHDVAAKVRETEARLRAAAQAAEEKSAADLKTLQADLAAERTALSASKDAVEKSTQALQALEASSAAGLKALHEKLSQAESRAASAEKSLIETQTLLTASTNDITEARREAAESSEFAKTASREFKELLKRHDALLVEIEAVRHDLAAGKEALARSDRAAADASTNLRTAQKENSTLRQERDRASSEAARLAANSAERAGAVLTTANEFFERIIADVAARLNRLLRILYASIELSSNAPAVKPLHAVRSAAEALVTSLEDIHEFWQLETGHIELRREPFALRTWLNNLAGVYEFKASQRDIQFSLAADPEIPDVVVVDGPRLTQIVTAALDYLFETSEAGGTLDFAVSVLAVTSRDARLSFDVAAQAGRHGGEYMHHFSLTVAERLVGLLGGEFTVVDVPGDQRRITTVVTLLRGTGGTAAHARPRRRIAREDLEPVPAAAPRPTRAAPHRTFGVDHAASFDVAVRPSEPPPAVEVSPIIRLEEPAPIAPTPEPPRETAAQLPAEPESADERAPAPPARRPEPLPAPPPAEPAASPADSADAPRAMRVLVAEDNRLNQRAIADILKARGYEVTLAADGREALTHLTTARFDFALIDCEMPVMDGFSAVREARSAEQRIGRHTPIFAMTVYLDGDAESRCREAGMDELLTKPVRREPLLTLIDRFFPPK